MWIARKNFDELRASVVKLNDALEASDRLLREMQNKTFLTGMERTGRMNKFTFMRNGEITVIETMGLLSDNLPEWKERLIR